MIKTLLALTLGAATAGCTALIAGAVAVSTPEEIKRSQYTTTMASAKPLTTVSTCLKSALLNAKSGTNQARLTYRDIGAEPHQFTVTNNAQSNWSGGRPEILALLESSSDGRGGTTTQVWAHPGLWSHGGSQGYLDNTTALARPCMS